MASAVKPTCDLADLRQKVAKAPNVEILRQYVGSFLDTCPIKMGDASEKPSKKHKGTRKATERSKFMGACMRKTDKEAEGPGAVNGHGQGRSMQECSHDWEKDHPKKEAKK